MDTKLIRLNDDVLVEVQAEDSQKISHRYADKVEETIDVIKPLLLKVCRPVVEAYQALNTEAQIDQAEVELGLSFEGEGNVYITKAKAGANLTIKLVLKPKR